MRSTMNYEQVLFGNISFENTDISSEVNTEEYCISLLTYVAKNVSFTANGNFSDWDRETWFSGYENLLNGNYDSLVTNSPTDSKSLSNGYEGWSLYSWTAVQKCIYEYPKWWLNLTQSLNHTDNLPKTSDTTRLAWWESLLWSVVFGIMIFVAVAGNAIVIWIVLAHQRMRTVTNYFLLNLSVSDLLMAALNCAFNFLYMLLKDWPFGEAYCRFNNFVANVTVANSVFTLTAISVDRYVAIVRPLRPRMSRFTTRIVLLVIWLSSMLLALPCLLYSTTYTMRGANGSESTVCLLIWPDGFPYVSKSDYVYNLLFLALTYVMPILAMLACYSVIGKVLWGTPFVGELSSRHMENMRSKRKVVRMFIVLVAFFALCWLPYHMYFIYAYLDRTVITVPYVQHIYLGFYWLAMSNAMVNPLIYYWLNARFRQYFRQLMCLCRSKSRNDANSGHSYNNGNQRQCKEVELRIIRPTQPPIHVLAKQSMQHPKAST